jgi:16S rRNA (guanine527-N7)-methyltransferase
MRCVTTPQWTGRLEELVAHHRLPAGAGARLAALLELVRDDPAAPTTITDPALGADAHVADSLAALALTEVRSARSIADLGSGAGFPGLPLAVALPEAHVWLVESLRRKCAFLERAVEITAAGNVDVVCARAEEWPRRQLDAVTVRAVAPLSVLLEYAAPLLRLGGHLVAWKGAPASEELRDASAAAGQLGMEERRVVPVPRLPGADHHSLHVYSKAHSTPAKFPRRPGMARKRPLSA